MNLKLSRLTLVLFLGLPYFTSCSNDDLTTLVSEEENLPVSRSTSEKGRFDSEPFQWDYFISTNPEKKSSDEFVVYPVNHTPSIAVLPVCRNDEENTVYKHETAICHVL